MRHRAWAAAALVAVALGAAACGSDDDAGAAATTTEEASTTAPATTAPATTAEAAAGPGTVAAGKVVFTQNCAGCHAGLGTKPGYGPKLAGKGLSEAHIRNMVNNGGSLMPSGLVEGQDLADVVAYVLQPAVARPDQPVRVSTHPNGRRSISGRRPAGSRFLKGIS